MQEKVTLQTKAVMAAIVLASNRQRGRSFGDVRDYELAAKEAGLISEQIEFEHNHNIPKTDGDPGKQL
jgi:hypothetical protein